MQMILTRVGCVCRSRRIWGRTGVLTSWHNRGITAASHSHSHVRHRWGHSARIGACRTWLATRGWRRGWRWGWRRDKGNRCRWGSTGVEAGRSWLTAVHLLVCWLVHLWPSLLVHWRAHLLVHWWSHHLLVHLWALGTCHVVCYWLLWLLESRLLVLLIYVLVLLLIRAFAGVWCR